MWHGQWCTGFRRFAFKVLAMFRFKVSDKDFRGREEDLTYHILDLVLVILYVIWAIVAFVFDTKDILVVGVNTICILQTRLRTVISERAYIRTVPDVELREVVISRMPSILSCYNLLDGMEVVVSIVNLVLMFLMIFPENVISEIPISFISILTLATLGVDNFVYGMKSLYDAHLVLGDAKFQNTIKEG